MKLTSDKTKWGVFYKSSDSLKSNLSNGKTSKTIYLIELLFFSWHTANDFLQYVQCSSIPFTGKLIRLRSVFIEVLSAITNTYFVKTTSVIIVNIRVTVDYFRTYGINELHRCKLQSCWTTCSADHAINGKAPDIIRFHSKKKKIKFYIFTTWFSTLQISLKKLSQLHKIIRPNLFFYFQWWNFELTSIFLVNFLSIIFPRIF